MSPFVHHGVGLFALAEFHQSHLGADRVEAWRLQRRFPIGQIAS